MKVRFWGVRGSIPTAGPTTVKYGGNTSCIEIRGDNDEIIILDAGTGLRELGNFLIANDLKKGPLKLHILLSHTHWDHIQGVPFFGPAYIPTTEITFYGPSTSISGKLEDIVAGQMKYAYFPIKLSELRAKLKFRELPETQIEIPPFTIKTKYLNHPILTLGYRVEHNGKTFVSVYDTEPYRNNFVVDDLSEEELAEIDEAAMKEANKYVEEMNNKIIKHLENADLCVYDAQYRTEEYESKKGWGHSTIDHAIEAGAKGKVKKLALFHHDPLRTDEQVDEIQKYAKNRAREEKGGEKMIVFCSRERLEVSF